METGAQGDAAVQRRGGVQAVVVDHERLADGQLRAVVGDQAELVGTGGDDIEAGKAFR